MKKRVNCIIITTIIFLSGGFMACEKGLDRVNFDSTIYFPQSGLSELKPLWGASTYELSVYKAGINQSNSSFEVTVKYDQIGGEAFINDSSSYNLEINGTPVLFEDYPEELKYKLLPADLFELVDDKIYISGDDVQSKFSIAFKDIDENVVGQQYILPLKITDVTPQAKVNEDKSYVILHVSGYRNVFGGLYRSLGEVKNSMSYDVMRIDTEFDAVSIGENTIRIPGPEEGLSVELTINGNQVNIAAAAGSEKFNVKPLEGKSSVYSGAFSEKYQRNKGEFDIFYSYETVKKVEQEDGTEKEVVVVHQVEQNLKFWL